MIDDPVSLDNFLDDFKSITAKKILVHGGGKIASSVAEKMGVVSQYVNGRRITDKDTIDIVTMVYAGLVNKKIVAGLQARSINGIGLTGADANMIKGEIRPVKEIDYGFVGDISATGVNIGYLQLILENGLVPVFAPLTHNGKGQMLNTNADTIASVLAIASANYFDTTLVYCFEKKGILTDIEDQDSSLISLNKESYKQMLNKKQLFEGILPKIDNAFAAIDGGVKQVLIGHAKDIILNCSPNPAGTLISE